MKNRLMTSSRVCDIKFKGYSRILEETKGWYIGNIVLLYPPSFEECGECLCTTCSIQEQTGKHTMHVVDSDSICEFTGLYDGYGNEIYEGDILEGTWEDGRKTYDVIGWNKEEACFGLMTSYAWKEKKSGKRPYAQFLHSDLNYLLLKEPNRKNMRVVGNVYCDEDLMNDECES